MPSIGSRTKWGRHNPCYPDIKAVGRLPILRGVTLSTPNTAIVAAAFSFTGRYVARHLISEGVDVESLMRTIGRIDHFAGKVPAFPLD